MSDSFKIIKASAGAGKTFTLIKEYLKLCLTSKDAAKENFKHILAITFTIEASKDIRKKIIEYLSDIIENNADTGMGNILLNELNINPNSLTNNADILLRSITHDYSNFCVGTIDSFTQKLSRSFASDLGLPQTFNTTIDNDEVSDILIENIGSQLGSDNDDHKRLTNLLIDFVKRSMSENEQKANPRKLIKDFFEKILQEEAFENDDKTSCYDENNFKETDNALNNRIISLDKDLFNAIKSCHNNLKTLIADNNLGTDDFSGKSRGLPALLDKLAFDETNKEKTLEEVAKMVSGELKTFDKLANGYDEKGKECFWYNSALKKEKRFNETELNSIGNEISTSLNRLKKEVSIEKLDLLKLYKNIKKDLFKYALRSKIEQEIQNIINENEKVSITEFNKRIATVLNDYSVPFIYERIGEHYKYIFIDEFQDTSLLQWQNLIPLVANCLANGNLCVVVGDGKQSIYHWRNGEVKQLTNLPDIFEKPNTFDDYEKKFHDEVKFECLDDNWRTSKTIVNFNNDFFDYVINNNHISDYVRSVYIDEDKGAKIKQTPQISDSGFVQIDIAEEGNLIDMMTCDDYIKQRICQIIQDLTTKQGYNYKDIAIIIRSNKDCFDTANYLSSKNIPIISSTSLLLQTSMRVELIINTLSYLVWSDNQATIAAILYFWDKLHDIDITDNGTFAKAQMIAENKASLESQLGLEEKCLTKTQTKAYSLYDLCEALVRLYGFDTIEDPFLNYLFDNIQTWQTADNIGIRHFLEYWNKKKKNLSIKVPENANAVKITTIHKSKGLEFPVVIFPFSKGDIKGNVKGKWVKSRDLQAGFEPIPHINKLTLNSLNYKQTDTLQNNEADATTLENLNMIYVAMTRPKERLYVLSKSKQKDNNIFLDYVTHDDNKNKFAISENEYGATEYTIDHTSKERQKTDRTHNQDISDSQTINWCNKIKINETRSEWLQSYSPENLKPIEWGKIVHLILADIKTSDEIDASLTRKDIKLDEDTITNLQKQIRLMMEAPEIAEAYSENAKIKTECDILYNTNGKSEIIRPDRFAELSDKIIIIDYKTGSEKDEHKTQIKKYAKAASELTDKPIESYIAYIGTQKVKIVEV